jgi:hypothetical protein
MHIRQLQDSKGSLLGKAELLMSCFCSVGRAKLIMILTTASKNENNHKEQNASKRY